MGVSALSSPATVILCVALRWALAATFALYAAELARRLAPRGSRLVVAAIAGALATTPFSPVQAPFVLLAALAALGVSLALADFVDRRAPGAVIRAGAWLMVAVLSGYDFPALAVACLLSLLVLGERRAISAVGLVLLAAVAWSVGLTLVVDVALTGALPKQWPPMGAPTGSGLQTLLVATAIAGTCALALRRGQRPLLGPLGVVPATALADLLLLAPGGALPMTSTALSSLLAILGGLGGLALSHTVKLTRSAARVLAADHG